MSQNRTVVPGLDSTGNNFNAAPVSGGNQNLYSRGNRPAARGTIVPGMTEATTNSNNEVSTSAPKQHPGYPVLGFLYSISRTSCGEFWPLYQGPNSIGKAAECDIVLPEATVSGNHAVIVVRPLPNKGIVAAIHDPASRNGTSINGERIGLTAEECHNGDIITIGQNYQLLLMLIDAAQLGLTQNPNFIPAEVDAQEEPDLPNFEQEQGSTRPGGYDPLNASTAAFSGPASWGTSSGYSGSSTAVRGTVGMDGSVSGGNHGGTVPM